MGVNLTNVFHRTGEALINAINGTGPRLIINQGGQGSSKTFSTLQVIYNYLKGAPASKATLSSYALPHLKLGVISDFDRIISDFGENIGEIKSQPAQPIYKIGDSAVNCYGVEGNLAMAHGPRRDILFINECNRKITYEVFDQLFSRSKITLLDFNPDAEFWLHEKVLPNFPHVLIKSTFLDNPYLSQGELQNILMKKDKPGFENWWRVYGEGELGRLEGAVFKNWRFGEFDESLPYMIGLDFGFHPDPDACSKNAIDRKHKKIYVKELFYKDSQTSEDLDRSLEESVSRSDLIIGDSAEKRLIKDLSKKYNIRGVRKTDTVSEWIKKMQDYEIIITEDSPNVERELVNYIWHDKKAGVPIDAFNHLIDEIRYCFMESEMHRRGIRRTN